jgi:hypothetical protein
MYIEHVKGLQLMCNKIQLLKFLLNYSCILSTLKSLINFLFKWQVCWQCHSPIRPLAFQYLGPCITCSTAACGAWLNLHKTLCHSILFSVCKGETWNWTLWSISFHIWGKRVRIDFCMKSYGVLVLSTSLVYILGTIIRFTSCMFLYDVLIISTSHSCQFRRSTARPRNFVMLRFYYTSYRAIINYLSKQF